MAVYASNALRMAIGALIMVFVTLAVAPQAHAKVQDHCRRITVEGDAGDPSESATWYIYNNETPLPTTLATSCEMQPLPGVETNLEYMRRLAYRWGPAPCPPLLEPNPLEANNECFELGANSCRIKYKISPKTDGSKKRYVEFCCFKDSGCGAKLADPDPIPITVVVDRDGLPIPCPPLNCVDNCEDCTVDIDPIAMRHLPSAAGADCRDALAKAVNSYTEGTTDALTACHDAVAAGTVSTSTDCNSVTEDPATAAAVLALAPIVDDATQACALTRTPAEVGYDICAAPCGSITVTDWPDAADCLRCQAQAAASDAALAVYGPPVMMLVAGGPRSASPAAKACKAAVGKALTSLAATRAKETAKCQKKIDGGAALPEGVQSCKDNDAKLIIEKAEEKILDDVSGACSAGALTELGLCTGAAGADTVAGCIFASAQTLNDSVTGASFPNGSKCLLCGQTATMSLVRNAEECGNSLAFPAPNSQTTSGTPSCAPPQLQSSYLFDQLTGSGVASASFKGSDVILNAKLTGVRESDGVTPISGTTGWAVRWRVRVTLGNSSTLPDVTLQDGDVTAIATDDGPGQLRAHGSLAALLPLPANDYRARNVELLGVSVVDPAGDVFAVAGARTEGEENSTDMPATGEGGKGFLVREFSACGGSATYPAPNTTAFGIPACSPPHTPSPFKFAGTGGGVMQARVVGDDLSIVAALKSIREPDGITPADLTGWSLGQVVRMTFRDPANGEMTIIDAPFQIPFQKVLNGNGTLKGSLHEVLMTLGLLPLNPPAQIAWIDLEVRDGFGNPFAHFGLVSKD